MTRRFVLPVAPGVAREVVIEGGKAHARTINQHTNAVMKRNQELRRNTGAVKTTSFGKLELDIPIQDLRMLDKFYPGIAQPGHPDHKWQLRRFMKSPASDPYRIIERKRGVNRGTHIIS